MNIALERTAEYVDGKKRREYGDAFVRGNNGEYLNWQTNSEPLVVSRYQSIHLSNGDRSNVHFSRSIVHQTRAYEKTPKGPVDAGRLRILSTTRY